MKVNRYSKLGIFGFLLLNGFYIYAHSHDHAHSHGHTHAPQSEKAILASQGIFDDKDVKDRTLADWQGVWQSINDYLLSGDLDEVLKNKVAKNPAKSFDDYKAYYQKGYATDIQLIGIEGNKMDFHNKNTYSSCNYEYAGYKILTYVSGKKGVRYLFTCKDKSSTAPKYVQFSDHIIEPSKSGHFHIYMGNKSHEALLKEMDNWPTYYPVSLSKDDIVHEMLHH